MIAETLLPYAKLLDGSDLIGESCFLFERCEVDFEGLKNNLEKAKEKKVNIPVLLFGTQISKQINTYTYNGNARNASLTTFDRIDNQHKKYLSGKSEKTAYKEKYFPHKHPSTKTITIHELKKFYALLQRLNLETLTDCLNNTFDTFRTDDIDILKNEIISTLYFPSTAEKPNKLIYALLALNTANCQNDRLQIQSEEKLLSKNTIIFIFITWYLHSLKGQSIVYHENEYELDYSFIIAGNYTGRKTDKLLISVGKNRFHFGSKGLNNSELIKWFYSIIPSSSDDIDTIKLDGRSYTAPREGISPTSSFVGPTTKGNQGNRLTDFVRNGGDTDQLVELIPNYSALISGVRFSIGKSTSYYFYPEVNTKGFLEKYLKAIKHHTIEVDNLKKKYFKELDNKNILKRDENLKRLEQVRQQLWVKLLLKMSTDTLLFSFEKKVGDKAGTFFSWSKVYTGLKTLKVFCFLYYFESPKHCGYFAKTLKLTGHNLSEGWVAGEKERLMDLFLRDCKIDWLNAWMMWRKFIALLDKKVTIKKQEHEFQATAWEGAFHFLMLLNQIQKEQFKPDQSGNELLGDFEKQMEVKMNENAQKIEDYLKEFFHSDNEKVLADINSKVADYSTFIDTDANESKWKAVVDGLICGWALKSICKKLRPEKDDYKGVIGGRSLSKMSPLEINEKMISLREKVQRQDQDVWNVNAPMEKLFFYVQQKSSSESVRLFTDALSLGFMRYDKKNK